MAATKETKTEGTKNSVNEQLAQAREQLRYHKIAKLAVRGPEGSPDEMLAQKLGVEDIEHHADYAGVLTASAERGVGGVMPWSTSEGEPIYLDATKSTKNLQAIIKTGRAMIATVEQPALDSTVLTKIVTAA